MLQQNNEKLCERQAMKEAIGKENLNENLASLILSQRITCQKKLNLHKTADHAQVNKSLLIRQYRLTGNSLKFNLVCLTIRKECIKCNKRSIANIIRT